MRDEQAVQFGHSPCPNDTFAFHALLHGPTTPNGLRFESVLEDIEALNLRALSDDSSDRLPLTKLSVPALARSLDRYQLLDAGAALGRGVGPLVLRRPGGAASLAELRNARVAIPGVHTTAHLLLRIFGPQDLEIVVMRFEQIMPALVSGHVDAGLVIHESRFTYPDHGLECVADLGEVWERETALPLPLGVIAAERSLGASRIRAIEQGLKASVQHAHLHPEASKDFVREHAQEMDADVCAQHIKLYVNDFSASLGAVGSSAIDEMVCRGRDAGFLPQGPAVFGDSNSSNPVSNSPRPS